MFEIEPKYFQLSNGIRVVFERKDAFVAHLGVMLLAGSRFEGPHEIGLAHFVEHCIFKGTEKRKAFAILTDLDSVGGELNAYTNKEELCVHASFRKIHFEIASELLGDIIRNANFPADEIEKEKDVILDELSSYLDSPQERIYDEFEDHLFHGHPLGNNILGTRESVMSFTAEDLKSFVQRHFFAENMVISVVGDIDENRLLQTLENDFGSVQKSGKALQVSHPIEKMRFQVTDKSAQHQNHIMIGGYAPSYFQDERRSMTLLTNYLGGPALNARLAMVVREQYAYAYHIEANYTPYSDSGYWSVYAGTDKKFLKKTVDVIHRELADVAKKGLTTKELEQAKEQLKGHIALSLDSNLELMFSLAKSVLVFGKVDSVKEMYKQIEQIKVAEMKTLAAKLFQVDLISSLVFEIK